MSNDVKTTMTDEPVRDWYPLWIDDEWYIWVDAQGRCIGKCGEGALDFTVQLSSTRDKRAVQALKIPRLVADTERENAYISELFTQELAAVRDVFNQPGAKTGLVGARDTSGPFQKPLRIQQLEEAMEWNGALLFVRFEKGQNPYLCLVNIDSDKPYPPKALIPRINSTVYEQIRRVSHRSINESEKEAKVWSQMVFVVQTPINTENGTAEQNVTTLIFNASSALRPEQTLAQKTWYTCIPSITYDWSPNTLQEAIVRGDRGNTWSINEHLEMVEQVCKGINVLHNKGMLHADIRPTNIVYLGDPKDPANYVLSDYGSFAYSTVQPLQTGNQRSYDGIITGPVIEGERVSPFYAPERGAGRERENADMAIVISPDNGLYCYIIVGWRFEFVELGLLDEVANPKMDVNQYMKFIARRRNPFEAENSSLNAGDRVQLRDYVFELTSKEEILGNIQIFQCDQKFWTVYHGRIAIYENKPHYSCFAFPIPRIIGFPQWSAATDIYSLGVLCLYSVYSDLLIHQTRYDVVNDTNTDPKSFADFYNDYPRFNSASKNSTVKLDEDFEIMLKYLADKSLFNAVWPQIEWLREQIEDKLGEQQHWTAERLAQCPYEPNEELEWVNFTEAESEERTLQSETVKVISQITSTVPGIERLLRPFSEGNNDVSKYQLGSFIFFLHFVLRCLHRQDSLDTEKEKWVNDGWMTAPFCKDRREPLINGAVNKAIERLMEIRSIINASALKGLTTEKDKIAQFDLRSENEIRRAMEHLKIREGELQEERERERQGIELLKQKERELLEERERQRQEIEVLKQKERELEQGMQLAEDKVLARTIVFAPEHRSVGMSVLTYFVNRVNREYSDRDVRIGLEQNGSIVRLIVLSNSGDILETVEHDLANFGLVLKGKLRPSEYETDPMDVLRLENKLELTISELRMESRIRNYLEKRIISLEEEVHRSKEEARLLHNHIGVALQTNQKATETINSLADKIGGDRVQGDMYQIGTITDSPVVIGRKASSSSQG